MAKKRLGEILLESGVIDESQLKEALKIQKERGGLLGDVLVSLGYVSEDNLAKSLSEHLGLKLVDPLSYDINPEVLAIVPEQVARKYNLIPLDKEGNTLYVAMSDPLNIYAIEELKSLTGLIIRPYVSPRYAIKRAIEQVYGITQSMEDVLKTVDEETLGYAVEPADTVDLLQEMAQEAPVIKAVNLLISQGIRERASDIHIEPEEKEIRVRYRIDGILYKVQSLPKKLQLGIISRIKVLAHLNIAEKRLPQDGRVIMKMGDREVDLRISTFPTIYGENVVIRILEKEGIFKSIEELGLSKDTLTAFQSLIRKPYGMILVTGPTGSGKTTTLYSALSFINAVEKNIITIEDPVEYQIRGIRQTQINPRVGLNFANALRNILRQDPDIIMVGEIRDLDTAKIAVEAALTGHLVFSTLHTNDAPSSIPRLVDMGVEPYLLSSCLLGTLAQRLARVICPYCKEEHSPPADILELMGVEKGTKFYRGKGCKFCRNTGYLGRIGIFELMIMNDKLREIALRRVPASEVRKVCVKMGMKTLREAGLEKAIEGMTTLEELLRVTEDVEG
ncbi:MAG: type II secretion system ATPase GspE [Caldiserica bacterium]|nr:type II secretion system ATPase GspE [Caldisericota bacterium]